MEVIDRKEEIAQYIGKKVLKLRKSKKMSREQFAEKTNLSANYIYEVENGNSIPGGLALIDICNFSEITPSSLLGKYLNSDIYSSSKEINNNFEKLSDYDKKLVIDMINFLANR